MVLQPIQSLTKGEDSMHIVRARRGVPQGSPLSSTIFSLYFDWYIELITVSMYDKYGVTCATGQKLSLVLFADEVEPVAKSFGTLDFMLSHSKRWSKKAEMTWSTKN